MQIRLLPRKIIGQTIRGIRTRLGMSPADFANSLGVADVAEVGRWERGTAQPDYGTLAKIATMGMVDAFIFHDPQGDGASPQLTPGEAGELDIILTRMEGLLNEARALVDRASSRTAVELLDAASGSPPARALADSTLLLDAEVRVEATPRTRSRTASASRRASGTQTRGRAGTSSPRSTRGGSASDTPSSGGSSNRSSSGATSGSGSASKSGSGSKSSGNGGSGGARSSSSRSGSTSRTRSSSSKPDGGSSGGSSKSGAGASS